MNKEQKQIIGFTGHRKLQHDVDVIRKVVREKLYQYNAGCAVVGMALGFDMLVAEVCVEEKIPFVAAVPCRNQTKSWSSIQKQQYRSIIDKAWKTTVVSSGKFAIWKLFARDKWIVNRSNVLLSYWDGIPKGGAYGCIEYAKSKEISQENLFILCQSTT
jgi:uncharacterized phage-like protein YoqJ